MLFNINKWLLFTLLFLCLFDSQDLLLGLKTPIFIIIILYSMLYGIHFRKKISYNVLTFVIIFSFILPFLSLSIGLINNRFDILHFDGFVYWKAFFFLLIIFVLQIHDYDLINPLVNLLSLLSILTVIFYIIAFSSENFFNKLYYIGNYYGILAMGYRNFGEIRYPFINFHSSPLLVIPVAYYSYKIFALNEKSFLFLALLIINILGMIFTGTRNNIFMSIVTCILIWLYYKNNRKRLILIIVLIICFILLLPRLIPGLEGMFSISENSNSIKIGHLISYSHEFKDLKTLIFGQGLGSFFYSNGVNSMVSNTELTYLETIRRFGLIMGSLVLLLIMYPLLAIKKSNYDYIWLFIAYGCYLIMINFNPFFFSSTGMIILSIVLFKMDQLKSIKR